MSTGFPYGSFLRTSGDKYPGVPAKPGGVIEGMEMWNVGVGNSVVRLISI